MHTHVTALNRQTEFKKRIDYKIGMRRGEIHLFISLQCCHSHRCIRRMPAWGVRGGRAEEERQNFCLSGTMWKWVNIHTFTYAQNYSHPPKCSLLLGLCEVAWRRKLVFLQRDKKSSWRAMTNCVVCVFFQTPEKNGINPVRLVHTLCIRIFHHLDQTHHLNVHLCKWLWKLCQHFEP